MIWLLQALLTEQGLHESCRVLRQESGVLGKGLTHTSVGARCRQGQWGQVLETLESLQLPQQRATLLARAHERATLELAEAGSLDLACASLRVVCDDLDATPVVRENHPSRSLHPRALWMRRALQMSLLSTLQSWQSPCSCRRQPITF